MNQKFAIVTGASSGIGKELARLSAREGYDLLIAADEPEITDSARELTNGVQARAVQADLATLEGVHKLLAATEGREIDLLFANAGRGLGKAFLEQDFDQVRRVVDTNVTGTIYLIQQIARRMAERGEGRILITGSVAGYVPGTFHAVYHATKAFIDSFAIALRHELKDSGVTVTLLMPGATETEFFERADLLDTAVGQAEKADPADVAKDGFDALMSGEEQVVSGWKNKLQTAAAQVTPASRLAEQSRKMNEPGSASRK